MTRIALLLNAVNICGVVRTCHAPVVALAVLGAGVLSSILASTDKGTDGPVAPIGSGYGANGPYEMAADTVPRRFFRHRRVYVYRPVSAPGPRPVVFFFSAFRSWDPANYDHLIEHLVSRGYCVVFPEYRLAQFPCQRRTYRRLFNGAVAGLRALGSAADTTRLGFAGHSFGGSAVPAFAWECLTERNLGGHGTFMYIMAPFFVFCIQQDRLQEFTAETKLLMQVFENDDCNDHRMAKDLFEAIGIPDSEKDYMVVLSDTCAQSGYVLEADHATPFSGVDSEGEVDGLDYYGIFRPIDALADYVWNGNSDGHEVALGNGSHRQCGMGEWPDGSPVRQCLVSDEAPLLRPKSQYYFRWSHPWNFRRQRDDVRLADPWDPDGPPVAAGARVSSSEPKTRPRGPRDKSSTGAQGHGRAGAHEPSLSPSNQPQGGTGLRTGEGLSHGRLNSRDSDSPRILSPSPGARSEGLLPSRPTRAHSPSSKNPHLPFRKRRRR